MRMRVVSVVVVAVLGLAGCAGAHHVQGASATGTISGRLGIFGGPLDPKTGRMAADNAPGQDTAISVRGPDGRVVTTMTHADGRYSLDVPAGRYTLTPACGVATVAVVVSGHGTVADLRCDVP
jgi:hypothetical protein